MILGIAEVIDLIITIILIMPTTIPGIIMDGEAVIILHTDLITELYMVQEVTDLLQQHLQDLQVQEMFLQ